MDDDTSTAGGVRSARNTDQGPAHPRPASHARNHARVERVEHQGDV